MGSLLRLSIREVRALSYPEFRAWQLFYAVEPWGWGNDEYLAASVMAKLHNNGITKKSDLKSAKHFMRDMPKEIFDELEREKKMQDFEELPFEERRQVALMQIRKDFGIK